MKNQLKHTLFLWILLLWVLLGATDVYAHEVPDNFFPIVIWMEASPELMGYDATTAHEFFEKSFKKMVTFGFNTVRPSNLPHHEPQIVNDFLNLAHENNLMVILDPGEGHNLMQYDSSHLQQNRNMWLDYLGINVISRFYRTPNLLGYALIDEPPAYIIRDGNNNPIILSKEEKLTRWGLIVEMLDELDPEHHDYTVFNSPSWLAYAVDSFTLKAIAFDNYPFEAHIPPYVMGPDNEYNWYTRLQAFHAACMGQYTLPRLSVIQTFEDNVIPYRYPKPSELRTCVYTSLAAGARGIMYFLFMDINLSNGYYERGLLDSSFHVNNMDLLKEVLALNQELGVLGPWLARLEANSENNVSGWEPEAPVLAGSFINTLGVHYYIVANKDPHPGHPPVTHTLQMPGNNYYVTDRYSREEFHADSNGQITIPLDPAQGRVLRAMDSQPLTVTSPQNGDKWFKGFIYPINWYSTGIQGDISLQLVSVNGEVSPIVASFPYNSPPYNYHVPADITPGTYFILISQNNLAAQSALFEIAEPSTTAIEIDKTDMTFLGRRGKVFFGSFRVRSGDGNKLRYTITDNQTWLSASPSRGVSTGEFKTINVVVDLSRLEEKTTYHGTITVSGHEVAPKTVSVTVQVRPRSS